MSGNVQFQAIRKRKTNCRVTDTFRDPINEGRNFGTMKILDDSLNNKHEVIKHPIAVGKEITLYKDIPNFCVLFEST